MSDPKLVTTTERALAQLREWQRPIIIQTDMTNVMGLLGMVQLALRHPQAKSMPTARLVERFIVDLIERIDPEHGDIWTFFNAGFNPTHDV